MTFWNWSDAMAVAYGRAVLTGRRQVVRAAGDCWPAWSVTELEAVDPC